MISTKWFTSTKYITSRLVNFASKRLKYDMTQWQRVVMDRHINEQLAGLDTGRMDAMEVSPNPKGSRWKESRFASFTAVHYPQFDLCRDTLDDHFDVIFCDQVFEHLDDPEFAARNVLSMLRPGGLFVNTTPFLVRFHPCPNDCTRWTERGMSRLLSRAGFDSSAIETHCWGNKKCVVDNLRSGTGNWSAFGWGKSIENDPMFPVVVWCYAKAPV